MKGYPTCICLLLALVGGDHHADVRPHAGELAHNVLITPLDVVDTADLRSALGRQPGNHHGRPGPQVAGLDLGAGEALHPLNDGDLAVHLDLGAHATELIHIWGCMSVGKPG